ncbi:MAG: alpha/beta hydrolase [Actinomycetota bacterium]
MQEFKVLEGAEEFELGAGPVGALLVHGFTGSPQSMRPLGDYLAARGIAVMAPRLPGHGTAWEDLNTRTAEEWVAHVEESFNVFAAEKEEVYLVGLSFGAALCLNLAAHYPDRVDGVVALSTFLLTKDPLRFLTPVVRRLVRSLPGAANDIADPEQRELAYDRLPTGAAHVMLQWVKQTRRNLGAVRAPILLMHSHHDHTAHPSTAPLVYESVSSEDKQLVWVDNSYHVITLDRDRDEVYRRTYEFIEERSRHAL